MTRANAARHVELWRDVVRRAPAGPARRAGRAARLRGLARGQRRARLVRGRPRARRPSPDYGLAGLLAQALAGAVPPSAWQPFPPDALTLFAG